MEINNDFPVELVLMNTEFYMSARQKVYATMRLMFPFFWRPRGLVPSLADLSVTDNVLAKRDVSLPVRGKNSGHHPLIVAELAGGKIIGDLRLVATAGDAVVGGLQGLFGCADPHNHYLLHRRRLRVPKYWSGTALLLGTANSDNYYHWLLESLPRWKMLQAAGYVLYDHVLLHSKPLVFQDETLDRLKVPREKRRRLSKNFVHQFERLIVPAMPFPPERVSPWACAWVRSLFPETVSGPEMIYLARPGIGRRALVNQPELETELKARGFVSIQPEALTVAEQAKQLGSARYVIAPHGAALANVVFAPAGAAVLELFHPQHKKSYYLSLAEACGLRYACLDGQPTGRADDHKLECIIDVSAVLEKLEQASRCDP